MKHTTYISHNYTGFGRAAYQTGLNSPPKNYYDGRQAQCPGASWLAYGYISMVRGMQIVDMPQA